ncbi:hypothetical protein [Candidatus Enterococcus lemimoniae]|uniref:Addiction module toxin RelE n=1 Tax=Candidatus Enterococcus lemimoniae TaxID=1834167 RepID=A0ABZ2T6N2_9ENTE|nr:hypothetical protein [Enterococcus sp. 12C11_DIV0727]OTO71059.1 hypothetical protein A5866_003309 [Enterococcus sp. 12C11_DIV0727]
MTALSAEYTESFRLSLRKLNQEWSKEYFFTDEKITTFVQSIYKSIELTKIVPEMHEEISAIYNFNNPIYRILIGKNYAIFYRIDRSTTKIMLGNMYYQRQLHISF